MLLFLPARKLLLAQLLDDLPLLRSLRERGLRFVHPILRRRDLLSDRNCLPLRREQIAPMSRQKAHVEHADHVILANIVTCSADAIVKRSQLVLTMRENLLSGRELTLTRPLDVFPLPQKRLKFEDEPAH